MLNHILYYTDYSCHTYYHKHSCASPLANVSS